MSSNRAVMSRQYRFGCYTLDAGRRLLWKDGGLVPLTPKTVDVLAFLIERAGQVVEKDDLLRFVWPNTVVEENNLARHVSMLRKALQQRRGQHDFISTIPGHGYMFVAPVEEVDEAVTPVPTFDVVPEEEAGAEAVAAVPPASQQPPSVSGAGRSSRFAILALAAAVAVVTGAVLLYRSGGGAATSRVELRQLTFGGGVQRDPAWSPDGAWLAYAADGAGSLDIYRRSVADPAPVRLTSDAADESQPDWSPDGRWLAFRSERDGGGIYVLPATGGTPHLVARFGFFPRWSPDGSRILFRGSMLRGIDSGAFVVNRDGTHLAPVRPDLLKQFKAPHVTWHPDGTRLSIAGRGRDSAWAFVTAPVAGGAAVASPLAAQFAADLRTQGVTLGQFVWAASGRQLYFEGRAAEAQGIWRVAVDPHSFAWTAPPEQVSTGPGQYADLALSPDATRLAFTVGNERTRVWSFPFVPELGTLTGEGRPVTPGGPAEFDAATPLDGSRVAYRTVRGGRQELWQRSVSGEDERLLVASDNAMRTSPRWSRDGTRLAYLRSHGDGRDAAVSRAIAIIPAGGGPEELLDLPTELDIVPDDWSADGSWILASCRRSAGEPRGTCLMRSSAGALRDLRVIAADTSRDLICQRFSPDERWISFMAVDRARRDVSTLYVMPATGGRWIPITSGDSYDDKPRWSPDGRVLYYLSARDGTLNLWGRRFDPAAGTAIGDPFRVTSFRATGPTLPRDLARVEIAVAANRLFVPITEASGTIWMLDGVTR
jgi:Tol biopolymer transport system component/DNA-binding winged helix-turn-helix (wHTH) protein